MDSSRKTSFVRKGRLATAASTLPAHSKVSSQSGQLVISSGLADFDGTIDILCGGQIVGTVILIEEDRYSTYAKTLLKYFVAEGVACKHKIALASADEDCQSYLKKLPYISTQQRPPSTVESTTKNTHDDIKIAWQYKKYLAENKDMSSKTIAKLPPWCHSFDLQRNITQADLDAVQIETLTLVEGDNPRDKYRKLYSMLNKLIYKHNTEIAESQPGTIVRIALPSLCSPFWGSNQQLREKETLLFLHALRGLMRQSLACCMITMPTYIATPEFQAKVRHLVDAVFSFNAFTDSDEPVNEAFSEFNGLFITKKLPRVNSLVAVGPLHPTFGFRMKRKKLTIESIHLGPEGSDSLSDSTKKREKGPSLLCRPGPPSAKDPLDF